MQPQRALPSRSSRPVNLSTVNNSKPTNTVQHASSQQRQNIGAVAAHALTSSLANPYGQRSGYQSYTNPNYHAYFTQMQRPMTNAGGYSISSAYNPNENSTGSSLIRPKTTSQRGRRSTNDNTSSLRSSYTPLPSAAPTREEITCGYDGCSFSGLHKTVEIHKMDRHLMFPAGWKKPRGDWDADPSLKGKPVPIPGTGVMLDTPEAIEAWIAERKKRWPSKQNVYNKKRKAQEAADRGEIDPSELTARGHKRRRIEGEARRYDYQSNERGRGRGHWRGRGGVNPEQTRPDSGWIGRGRGQMATFGSQQQKAETYKDADTIPSVAAIGPVSEDSDSNSDMDPVKDAVTSKASAPDFPPLIPDIRSLNENHESDGPMAPPNRNLTSALRPRVRKPSQPRAQPPNPFATRPSLLRNLLLPEIRHTVSNLSQAIHFLVDNDFLDGVELQPGDAESQLIKVLNSTNFANMEPGERSTP